MVESKGKDNAAGLKLLGGLVRLDALQPGGFTAYDLADYASVQTETARAFLSRSKGPGYAEAIPEGNRPNRGGRPAKLYRLRPDRRADLLQRITELRYGLNTEVNVQEPSKDELFTSLKLLEAILKELELGTSSPGEWRARLAEARLELRGGEADLCALQAKASAHAADFARRLSAAQNQLAAIERAGPPCGASTPSPLDPVYVSTIPAQDQDSTTARVQWRAWLLSGVKTWTRTQVGSVERISAFAPLSVDTFDYDGPGQLARLINGLNLPRSATVLFNQELIDAIATWKVTDEISTVIFLLQLAGHINSLVTPQLETAIRVLLHSDIHYHFTEETRSIFSLAVSFAATRLPPESIRRTAQQLRTSQLHTPEALVQMVVLAATADYDCLITDTDNILLDVLPQSVDSPVMLYFANVLVDRLGMGPLLRIAYSGDTRVHCVLQNILERHRVFIFRYVDAHNAWFRDRKTDNTCCITISPTRLWARAQARFDLAA